MGLVISLLLCVILATGCAAPDRVDVKKETEKLLQTDRDFAAASVSHGAADAFNMYLHDNATMFSDGRFPIVGREAAYNLMKAGDRGSVLKWTPRAAEVAGSGDMGWTWGEYVLILKEGGEEKKSYGKYVNVWKKNSDGDWKVIADIGNSSPAPATDSAE